MRWSVAVQRAADQENADAEQHPQTQTHKTETQCGTDRSVILRSLPLVHCGPCKNVAMRGCSEFLSTNENVNRK
jgi:hypothetical protein